MLNLNKNARIFWHNEKINENDKFEVIKKWDIHLYNGSKDTLSIQLNKDKKIMYPPDFQKFYDYETKTFLVEKAPTEVERYLSSYVEAAKENNVKLPNIPRSLFRSEKIREAVFDCNVNPNVAKFNDDVIVQTTLKIIGFFNYLWRADFLLAPIEFYLYTLYDPQYYNIDPNIITSPTCKIQILNEKAITHNPTYSEQFIQQTQDAITSSPEPKNDIQYQTMQPVFKDIESKEEFRLNMMIIKEVVLLPDFEKLFNINANKLKISTLELLMIEELLIECNAVQNQYEINLSE
eukprot:303855_1